MFINLYLLPKNRMQTIIVSLDDKKNSSSLLKH